MLEVIHFDTMLVLRMPSLMFRFRPLVFVQFRVQVSIRFYSYLNSDEANGLDRFKFKPNWLQVECRADI